MKVFCWLILAMAVPVLFGLEPVIEQEPIRYSESTPDTEITRIVTRIENGEKLLTGRRDQDVLRELLNLLDIPIESQVLVYSKTSAQNGLITPSTPRAIYFSDNAYVGWVPGGNIEVITFDEELGAVFHMVYLEREKGIVSPKIKRDRSCLDCHAGSATGGFPGPLVRSVYPGYDGLPIFHAGTFRTDDTSPLSERWGGWYVTGSSGEQEHLGNILASEDPELGVVIEKVAMEPVDDLSLYIDTEPYPGGGKSDIVALMVLEHQKRVHNSLVQANLTVRQMLHRQARMRDIFKESRNAPLSATNRRILEHQTENVVAALLFHDEFSMEDEGVEGALEFQAAFESKSRKSSENRSLRDFRLYERLFKYRCSYVIYSEVFGHLPEVLKKSVLNRLAGILTSKAVDPEFSYLSESERERIFSILSETNLEGWPSEKTSFQ